MRYQIHVLEIIRQIAWRPPDSFASPVTLAFRIREIGERCICPFNVSRKIWSGEKIGPAGPILATKSGPAGPKMTPKFVRANQNWSGHITP